MNIAFATRTALLGLRVADAHRGEVVHGLRAWAWDARLDALRSQRPEAARGQEARFVREARPTSNGALAWHELPFFGGWRATAPAADESTPGAFRPWDPTHRRPHGVLIVDPSGQLYPLRLQQQVPWRGLVTWPWDADDVRPALRAYPTPVHPRPDGSAAVRARLWDVAREAPAAWALLRVRANGRFHVGLAGEDGQVVVFVPFPRPRPGTALNQQSWPLTVEVAYARLCDPRVPTANLGTLPGPRIRADLPTLDAIEQQPAAQLFATWQSAAAHTPFIPPPLSVAGELYLASAPRMSPAPPDARQNCLLVTP